MQRSQIMKIIPHRPYETNSRAEYRVFDKLKEAFVGSDDYVAFHSLNLTKHKDKRFGEADFVIICRYGLFVLEVKGGGISCHEGVWSAIDRNDEQHRIQNPFKQAQTALHAIHQEIKGLDRFAHLFIPIGYGVIYPDVNWRQQSAEWEMPIICDRNKFKNFESFLVQFFKHWHHKPNNSNDLSVTEINNIAQYLRPNFEIWESLYCKLASAEQMVITLTDEQYSYLDIVASNRRVLCSGGAGTGKTFLALELSNRIARADKSVMIVCKSHWLKHYLQSKLMNEFVIIATIKGAKVALKRAGIEQCDALIVDEGQDLFNREDMALLDELLVGGLAQGEWYIFHDVNNQSGLFESLDRRALELLESYAPAKVPLSKNCRNTNPILHMVEGLLGVQMGSKNIDNGANVIEKFDYKKSGVILDNMLDELLKNGVSTSSITILSPLNYEQSSVNRLPEIRKQQIIQLDEYSIQSFPPTGISFAEIKHFKGLENEVIILVDMYQLSSNRQSHKVLYYVAMSRARGLLSIIWSIANPLSQATL